MTLDWLTIEDDALVGNEASLLGHRYIAGTLILGRVTLRTAAVVEPGAVVMPFAEASVDAPQPMGC